jgi:lipopolysaccharide export LptBFGC system permease protein LptF
VVLLLVPQALPIAIPIGLVVGILQALRHGVLTRASHALILAIGIVLSIGSFAIMGWVVPETNQAYRETIFRRLTANGAVDGGVKTLSRGPTELRFGQLRRAGAEQSPEAALRADTLRRPRPTSRSST